MKKLCLSSLLILSLCTCVRAQQSITSDSLTFARIYQLNKEIGWRDTVSALRLDTLKVLADRLDQPSFRGRYHGMRADQLRFSGKQEEARPQSFTALTYLRTTADSSGVANTLFNLARTYLPEGNYTQAFIHYEQALDRFRALGDRRMEIGCLSALGVVQRRSKQLDRAREYFESALEKAEPFGDRDLTLGIINNLGVVNKQQKNFEAAIRLYEKGLNLAEQDPVNSLNRAYFHLNISSCYRELKRPEAALQYADRAYEWFSHAGSNREKSMTLLGMAVNNNDLGRYQQAITACRRALEVVGPESAISSSIHQVMQQSFRSLSQTDSAFHHLEQSNKINLELERAKRSKALDELETKFQSKEQQAEIERLEAEESASNQQLRRRNFTLAIALFALGLLGWLLWRNQRQKQVIEQQNATITKALGEKEMLLKEIHHRVKNNLQMVSSLLNMQTHYMKDKAAVDALQLGRSRVRSMALIHQKLYLGDEVSTFVDAKDYLERLVREIIDTHTPVATKIQLQLDVEPLELDIDTVVPLGLLTNEAVTNAAKYAFTDREAGQLKVRLWQRAGKYTLSVTDDGPGLRPSTNEDSFGHLLMRTLAEQLEGELTINDGDEGVEVVLRF